MMRCEKMHATMTVDQCMRNQDAKAGIPCLVKFSGPKYMMCQDCEQGRAARNGRLNDDDVEKLKEDEMSRKNLETVEVDTGAPAGDSSLECATKRCTKCGEVKSLESFANQTAKSGRIIKRPACRDCNKKYMQSYWSRRQNAGGPLMSSPRAEPEEPTVAEPVRTDVSTGSEGVDMIVLRQDGDDTIIRDSNKANFLIIDFARHQNLLGVIRSIADDEERTTESQVIYWLKKHLNVRKDGINGAA